MSNTKDRPLLATDDEIRKAKEDFAKTYIFDRSTEIFQSPFGAGYWLFGVEYDTDRGWLVMETGGEINGFDADHSTAVAEWKKGIPPEVPYYRLDREFADKAFRIGCRMFGERWMDDIDLPRVDIILQATMLGEERYA